VLTSLNPCRGLTSNNAPGSRSLTPSLLPQQDGGGEGTKGTTCGLRSRWGSRFQVYWTPLQVKANRGLHMAAPVYSGQFPSLFSTQSHPEAGKTQWNISSCVLLSRRTKGEPSSQHSVSLW